MNLETIEARAKALPVVRETFTADSWWWYCDDCPVVDNCEYRFDAYNVEGLGISGNLCLAFK